MPINDDSARLNKIETIIRIIDQLAASGSGVSMATGRPRSVISMLSPSSTRRNSSLARCRSSLTPTVAMCYL